MTDLTLMAIAMRLSDRADAMCKRGRYFNDGSEESLFFAFDAFDALDILGARIDAEKQKRGDKPV